MTTSNFLIEENLLMQNAMLFQNVTIRSDVRRSYLVIEYEHMYSYVVMHHWNILTMLSHVLL